MEKKEEWKEDDDGKIVDARLQSTLNMEGPYRP